MKPSQDKERLVAAVEVGEDMFWNAIASAYPEIKSGDFAPDIAMEMADKLTQFVTVWLKTNEHDVIPEPRITVTEILLHRIEYAYDCGEVEMPDGDREHIAYYISQGFSEGELCTSELMDADTTVRGYWKINNCPDA